ncbi:hypothetical protein UlMin_014063 [Ulmus minor]
MGNIKCPKGSKKMIILVPYPAQGHVTPMLKLATALAKQGFQPVIITPENIHEKIVLQVEHKSEEVVCMAIEDGMDKETPRDFFSIEAAMEINMPAHLERLVGKLEEDGQGVVVCFVVDLLASWAIQVANRCGIPVAGFWPAMLATYRLIAAIPDMVRAGHISDTGCPQHLGPVRFLPSQPILSTEELPWLVGTLAARKARFKFWTRTLSRSRNLQCVLINSFPDEFLNLEQQRRSTKTPQGLPLFYPIGPVSKLSTAKNPSLWEEDSSCLEWLDKREPNSVIYISFGSWVTPIGEAKVRNLALALESLGHFFIWVVGNNWRAGLPDGYLERVTKKQGKLVSWAPQMEILKHRSVGCYLTHCGWNSTMEAIQCQKRLLCYPVAGDQFVNCNYIVKVWKIGVRISGFGERDVEEGFRRVMEDLEMGNRLKKLCERTVGDEASSRVMANLMAFTDGLGKPTLPSGFDYVIE